MDSVDLDVLKSSCRWLEEGYRVLLATVVKTWGSRLGPKARC
jgi:xanthine dehydrogenase accessory factor